MRNVIRDYIRAAGPVTINAITSEVREQVPNLPHELELDSQIESHLQSLICEKQIELWIDRRNYNTATVCFNIHTGEI